MISSELFCTRGNAPIQQARRYETCGLDNIWLLDGYDLVHHDGEEIVVPEDREGLHKAIALHLVRCRRSLSGREIKFIRRAINATQVELAYQLGTVARTVARWENDQNTMPAPEERLLRITAILGATEPDHFARLISAMPKTFGESDEGPERPMRFRHDQRWTDAELEEAA